ncbi:tyrosine-type recombinase/integrase [Emticicia fontis]
MPLSDLECRLAKPKEKAYRLFDSGGLYLDVKPTGIKVWRLKFNFLGKEKLLTIGRYPNVSLLDARVKQEAAKTAIDTNIDPAMQKQQIKKFKRFEQAQTFELVALEWHKRKYNTWSENYARDILRRLHNNVFPNIGKKPIGKINVQDVMLCIQKMEDREALHLAKRVVQHIGQILRYAVITGRANRDFTPDLKDAVKKYRKKHYASISPEQLPELLDAINCNEPRLYKQTILGMKLLMLTMVRTTELINAQWDEFDLQKGTWHIPAVRMKMREAHFVPLSKQVITILHELGDTFGRNGYILPSIVYNKKRISNNTILQGLAKLGYKNIMTGHGFRSLAMSILKEKLNYRHEVVDRQLSHLPKGEVNQAYDRATFVPDRIRMMQDWADYIDLRSVKKLSSIGVKQTISLSVQNYQGSSLYHSFSMPSLAGISYKI